MAKINKVDISIIHYPIKTCDFSVDKPQLNRGVSELNIHSQAMQCVYHAHKYNPTIRLGPAIKFTQYNQISFSPLKICKKIHVPYLYEKETCLMFMVRNMLTNGLTWLTHIIIDIIVVTQDVFQPLSILLARIEWR